MRTACREAGGVLRAAPTAAGVGIGQATAAQGPTRTHVRDCSLPLRRRSTLALNPPRIGMTHSVIRLERARYSSDRSMRHATGPAAAQRPASGLMPQLLAQCLLLQQLAPHAARRPPHGTP